MDIHNCQQQKYTDLFSKQNIWSNIGINFQNYHKEIISHLMTMNSQSQLANSENESKGNAKVQSFLKQISLNFQLEIKRKISKVLFDSSVRSQNHLIAKRQNQQLKQKLIENEKIFDNKSQEMHRKITDLQTLVKIYQKALINKRMKVPSSLEQQQKPSFSSTNSDLQKKQHKLIKIHVFDIKIENLPQESENTYRSNLSKSGMSSSFLSKSRNQPQALKDIERQWNKSVNLSSKSIKSGHKLSVKKDEKYFMKSSMKKQMSRSFMKQNNSHACKVSNKQNNLCQSTVSEFNINKY